VLAYHAREHRTLICPIVDAGAGGAIYAAFYRGGNNEINQVSEYYVGDIPGLAELIKEPAVLVATGAQKYQSALSQLMKSNTIEAMESVPSGASVALLAVARLESGEHDDTLALAPLYLKESTARAFVNKYRRRVQAVP